MGVLAGPAWAPNAILLNPPPWFFAHLGSFLTGVGWSALPWTFQGTCCRSACSSLLSHTLPRAPQPRLSLSSLLCLLHSGTPRAPPGSPLPVPRPRNSLRAVSSGYWGASLIDFPSLGGSLSLLTSWAMSQKPLLCILCPVQLLFQVEHNSSSCNSVLAGNGSSAIL